jgi:cystathionine gamma-synthase
LLADLKQAFTLVRSKQSHTSHHAGNTERFTKVGT